MPREGFDITHQLDSPSACRRAANTARKRNGEAPVTTLVWTDLEHFGAGDAVKAGPIETVVGMVQLTDHGGHEGHLIGFALGQGGDSFVRRVVIYSHAAPLAGDRIMGIFAKKKPRGVRSRWPCPRRRRCKWRQYRV